MWTRKWCLIFVWVVVVRIKAELAPWPRRNVNKKRKRVHIVCSNCVPSKASIAYDLCVFINFHWVEFFSPRILFQPKRPNCGNQMTKTVWEREKANGNLATLNSAYIFIYNIKLIVAHGICWHSDELGDATCVAIADKQQQRWRNRAANDWRGIKRFYFLMKSLFIRFRSSSSHVCVCVCVC